MKTVKIVAKIVKDNSGIFTEVPILLDENKEVIQPLLDYILKLKYDGKSLSTLNKYIKATQLLLEYMAANVNSFKNPHSMFETFSSRLYTGTIGEDGLDPSGLYWMPCSPQVARLHIYYLTQLTDWLAQRNSTTQMNPLVAADNYNQRLNYAAWFRKNQNNFLGHIKDKQINSTIHNVRYILGKRQLGKPQQDAIEFPEKYFEAFYFSGLGGAKDYRVAIRDQLILLLMHGGGLRESEVLHLWIEDVLIDELNTKSVNVRIYHPSYGRAPNDWRGISGKTTRAAYLKEKFVLNPRNELNGKKHVGWKNNITDNKDEYLEVHWFPPIFGEIFARLWYDYIRLLIGIERDHPYAFISFHTKIIGHPYTLNAFHYNYSQALKRIALKSCKANGLSPHSHRHSYGRRLRRAGVHEIVIKKCLHHASIESQIVYTTPSVKEVTTNLNLAMDKLYNSIYSNNDLQVIPSWEILLQQGFTDIDHSGLLSGKYPKLGKNNGN